MSLYKRNNVWWVRFTSPSGKRILKTTGTTEKLAAQEFHDKLKAEYWKVEKLGEKPTYLWNDAVIKWLQENEDKKSVDIDFRILRWLDTHLNGVILSSINQQMIQVIASSKAEATSKSTANRYLSLLRAILRRATYEWEWLDKAPKVRMFRVTDRRVRWLTHQQAKDLLDALPIHQRNMAHFGLATGLRQRNVCRMEWSQVDLDRSIAWIHPDQAKSKKAIAVPLNEDALKIIKSLKGVHEKFVFTYLGKPVWQVNTKAWRKAVKAAGLKDFRWHDLCHTWASWHVQAGTPLHVLQELGGWESAEMVRRYAHLDAGLLAQYAGGISISDTKLIHQTKSASGIST